MTTEDEVHAASEKFYAALNRMLNGDAGSLGDIWSHSSTVTTMHPIGGREVGWNRLEIHGSKLLSYAQRIRLNWVINLSGIPQMAPPNRRQW